jgi:hypothetical protein
MLPRIPGAIAVMLVAAACASTPSGKPLPVADLPAQAPPEPELSRGVGEVVATAAGGARGATYGRWRVAGTNVDLTYAGGNAWAGTLAGRNVQLTVSPGKIEGPGVNLYLTQEGQTVTARGTFAQRQISVTMTPDSLRGRMASNAPGFEVKRDGPDAWSGSWGPGGKIFMNMKGEAAQYPAVLSPQFYLALLGVLL